ncbi:MAG: ABC transporter permease [Chloroflexi bacterium]|nr:ABC transporter permease [Chloroflexota bacterium]
MIASMTPQRLRARLGSPAMLRILSLLCVAALWEVAGRGEPLIASYPTEILRAAVETFAGEVLPAFVQTLHGFAVGFGLSVLFGVPIGIFMSRSRLLELSLAPYITALYATPRVALIPVLILWLGVDFNLRVGVVIVSGIFPVILNTYLGGKEVDRDLLDVGIAFAASKFQQLKTIVVPASLPYIYAGLRIGIARALIGAIVAEMTVAAGGIGGIIKENAKALQMAEMFVPIILLGLLSIGLAAVVRWAERRTTMPWLWAKAKR